MAGHRIAVAGPGRQGVASRWPPPGLPTRQPRSRATDARTGSIEGCPWAAAWSGCARPTGRHTAATCKIGDAVAPLESLILKHLTENQVDQRPDTQPVRARGPRSSPYINWSSTATDDHERPRTSTRGLRPDPGQFAGSGGALPVTTEQKASSPSPVQSERHVREPRWDRGLIFGLIRLRSPTFIGVRINAAMQVADVNGIRRTIIQTSENWKVDGVMLVLP